MDNGTCFESTVKVESSRLDSVRPTGLSSIDTMGTASNRRQPMWLSYYGYVCDLYCIQCMI